MDGMRSPFSLMVVITHASVDSCTQLFISARNIQSQIAHRLGNFRDHQAKMIDTRISRRPQQTYGFGVHKNDNPELKYMESTLVDMDNVISSAHPKVLLSEIVTARRFCIDSFD